MGKGNVLTSSSRARRENHSGREGARPVIAEPGKRGGGAATQLQNVFCAIAETSPRYLASLKKKKTRGVLKSIKQRGEWSKPLYCNRLTGPKGCTSVHSTCSGGGRVGSSSAGEAFYEWGGRCCKTHLFAENRKAL